MKCRCLNPNDDRYPDYGGRGIEVCDEWICSYSNFLAYVGRKPSPELVLDRIDTNGHYEPGNVRWTTYSRNNRNARSNRILTFDGKSMCVADWADCIGLPESTISARLIEGWPVDKIFRTPHLRKENKTLMLEKFKNFDVDRMDLDDLISLLAFGKLMRAEYEKLGLEEPDWVNDKLKTLHREIKSKIAEKLASRASEIGSRLEALKTPTQKKAELERELKKIKALLGQEEVVA